MKTKLIIVSIVLLAIFAATADKTLGQETPVAKASRLLNESGFKFTKAADNVWSVPFETKAGNKFDVIVFTTQDMLAMFTVLIQKKDLKLTPDMMKRLLVFNTDFDRVKIGIDKDGDLIARIDLGIRLLDKQELQENLDQTAGSAADVLAAIKTSSGSKK